MRQGTGLPKRELLSWLALGLGIAVICVMIAFLPGPLGKVAHSAATKPDGPRRLIPFNLTDRTGRSITEVDLAGKFVVVNFAFTSCSLKCRECDNL
jgi:cytochrome oxidase Cu insertion factor (SCO1/SenC/PrrC family)